MKSELLAKSPILVLPIFALVLFIVVFVTLFIVTMRKRAPAYAPLERLPLDDDGSEVDIRTRTTTKGAHQ